MGAENFEVEASDGVVTLRFTVHPVDGNQKSDEEHLRSEELRSVQIADDMVIDKPAVFLAHHSQEISQMQLGIRSKGETLLFSVTLGAAGVGFLPLLVNRR